MAGSGSRGSAGRGESQAVLRRLRRDGRVLASAFRLPLRALDAERANVKRRYGVCYEDGSIRIRLRHVRTRELLRYSGLVDTLCHELAHLRHFDHGPRFHVLYRRILTHARRLGIYRPAPRAAASGRRPGSGEGLVLRGSSILPLVSLEPRRIPRPGAGRARPDPDGRAARRPGARQRPRPEQLELFR